MCTAVFDMDSSRVGFQQGISTKKFAERFRVSTRSSDPSDLQTKAPQLPISGVMDDDVNCVCKCMYFEDSFFDVVQSIVNVISIIGTL